MKEYEFMASDKIKKEAEWFLILFFLLTRSYQINH